MKAILRAIQLQTQIQIQLHDINTLGKAMLLMAEAGVDSAALDSAVEKAKAKVKVLEDELMTLSVTN